MLKSFIALTLALCFAAGPARAQFFGFPPAPSAQPSPQGQPQPSPQAQPRVQPKPQPPAPAKPQSQGSQQSAPQAQSPLVAPQTVSAPYDHDLQRLSEILGALHFLRGICGTNEGQKWRTEAQSLIDAEAPNGDRHDQMIASFNRGYRGFQQNYRSCTPAAGVAIRRHLEEGANIAREITARFAN
jgi:uncharacterized protein (TIGR02301 family)